MRAVPDREEERRRCGGPARARRGRRESAKAVAEACTVDWMSEATSMASG